jgi:hypothetical protein
MAVKVIDISWPSLAKWRQQNAMNGPLEWMDPTSPSCKLGQFIEETISQMEDNGFKLIYICDKFMVFRDMKSLRENARDILQGNTDLQLSG